MFGRISGDDAKETGDERPERVAAIQRITWAYLSTALYPEDKAWPTIVDELVTSDAPAGTIASK